MTRPTYASVTGERCTCDYLQNAASDPDNPIRFEARTAEYQFTFGKAMLVIYHCPFCGGAAPESQRSALFMPIPGEEKERLFDLLKPIKSLKEAVGRLGAPDFEGFSELQTPTKDAQASHIERRRMYHYHNLSKIVDVWITERPDLSVDFQLHGKPIDPKDALDEEER